MEKKAQRRISVTLPDFLVEETDTIASSLNRSRSEFIALAVKNYISEYKKIEQKEQMKKGYLEMGKINLSLAESALISDENAFKIYEDFLSESE